MKLSLSLVFCVLLQYGLSAPAPPDPRRQQQPDGDGLPTLRGLDIYSLGRVSGLSRHSPATGPGAPLNNYLPPQGSQPNTHPVAPPHLYPNHQSHLNPFPNQVFHPHPFHPNQAHQHEALRPNQVHTPPGHVAQPQEQGTQVPGCSALQCAGKAIERYDYNTHLESDHLTGCLCKECGYYTPPRDLNLHMRSHDIYWVHPPSHIAQEQVFGCSAPQCAGVVLGRNEFTRHLKSDHLTGHLCRECDEDVPSRYKAHMRCHGIYQVENQPNHPNPFHLNQAQASRPHQVHPHPDQASHPHVAQPGCSASQCAGVVIPSWDGYATHVKSKHFTHNNFCKVCRQEVPLGLVDHVRSHHIYYTGVV